MGRREKRHGSHRTFNLISQIFKSITSTRRTRHVAFVNCFRHRRSCRQSRSDFTEPLLENDRALLGDYSDCVVIHCGTGLGVEYDQPRQASDIEIFGCRLHARVFEGQSEPGHLAEVVVVLALVLVAGKEDDLDDFPILVQFVVKLDEQGSELAAWWAIVHAEVVHE